MPLYDCGHPNCDECERAFGPDRSDAVTAYRAREKRYDGLTAEEWEDREEVRQNGQFGAGA